MSESDQNPSKPALPLKTGQVIYDGFHLTETGAWLMMGGLLNEGGLTSTFNFGYLWGDYSSFLLSRKYHNKNFFK
jgi:hypothetical protein